MRQAIAPAVVWLSLMAALRAQPAPYLPVTIATVYADPSGFHGQRVMVTGRVERRDSRFIVSDGTVSLRVLSRAQVEEGAYDIRGVILDVGLLRKGDPLLGRLAFKIPLDEIYAGGWPKPGEELVLAATSLTRSTAAVVEIATPPAPPLDVDFSVPVDGEADVRLDTRIRLQFSRNVDAASLKDRIRMSYSSSDSAERGEPQPPAIVFGVHYDAGTHILEINPAQPLERFRPVKVDLLEGIVGTDGSALRPWSLRFSNGGSR